MAGDDDIDRLLREVSALESGPAKALPPAEQEKTVKPTKDGTSSGRLAWGGVAAVGGAAAGFLIGTLLGFLPWVSSMSTAVGAALGAFLVALISGPPRWFDSKD